MIRYTASPRSNRYQLKRIITFQLLNIALLQPKWWISQCNLFHILNFSWFCPVDAVIAVWLVQKLSWTWNRVCFYFTLRTLFQFRPIYNIPKLLQPELFFVIYKYLCKMLWYFRNICWSRLDKWTNRIWFSCWYRIDVQHRVFRCCWGHCHNCESSSGRPLNTIWV